MKYTYDTEFIENGETIELISIGIVAEDGREFYAVSSEFNQHRVKQHPWLVEHVWCHLPTYRDHYQDGTYDEWIDINHPSVLSREEIRNAVSVFLFGPRVDGVAGGGGGAIINEQPGDRTIELWAYYGSYDHIALAQLFGTMADYPQWLPMFTHEIMQVIETIPGFELPPQPSEQHNALADARWNMAVLHAAGVTGPQIAEVMVLSGHDHRRSHEQ